ncbi:hypothetical protein FHW15_003705 [Terracoccus luteus]|uniref:Uncharacterized protein n=1 Tax=Terracoccus luteus TaxID=53356 RepID=A0A839Q5P2_9MICO|nr:hypothetical protein [Terracoccus luteus]MBB2988522.1 hypothetical protein [Terracoccus luteus]MCP2174167.1 hypothetical protein [Terracoccus luteus]
MPLPPDSYVDSMPCDDTLLTELGRVTWAAARLHAGVRDAINRHNGQPSDEPFTQTLGQAVATLETQAKNEGRDDQVEWVTQIGRPAVRLRNAVTHAVTYTAKDGRQAIGTVDHSSPGRFLREDLRDVTLYLIHASMTLPS